MAGYFDSIRPSDYIIGGAGDIGSGLASGGNSMEQEQARKRAEAELNRPLMSPEDLQLWIDRLGPQKVQEIMNHPDPAALGVEHAKAQPMVGGVQGSIPSFEMGTPGAAVGGMRSGPESDIPGFPLGANRMGEALDAAMRAGAKSQPAAPSPAPAPKAAGYKPSPVKSSYQPTQRDWPQIAAAMQYASKQNTTEARKEMSQDRLDTKVALKKYEVEEMNKRFNAKQVRELERLDRQDEGQRQQRAVTLMRIQADLEIAKIRAQSHKDSTALQQIVKLESVTSGLLKSFGNNPNLAGNESMGAMVDKLSQERDSLLQQSQEALSAAGQPSLKAKSSAVPAKTAAPAAPKSAGPAPIGKTKAANGRYQQNGKWFVVRDGLVYPE